MPADYKMFTELLKGTSYYPGTPEDEMVFMAHCLTQYHNSFSQCLQDLWVLFESGMKHNGYFCEFGAGDGYHSSNTQRLQKEFGWAGVLCEPNEDYLTYLQMNCTTLVKIATAVCVDGVGGREVEFVIAEDPTLSTMYNHLNANGQAIPQRTLAKTKTLPTVTLNDLLEQGGAPTHVDYISVDTEGNEFEILESFDFKKWDVDMWTIEHNYNKEKAEKIFDLMAHQGYVVRFKEFSQFDYWFVKKELVEKHPHAIKRPLHKKRTVRTTTQTISEEI